jgi:hypothetical protein
MSAGILPVPKCRVTVVNGNYTDSSDGEQCQSRMLRQLRFVSFTPGSAKGNKANEWEPSERIASDHAPA